VPLAPEILVGGIKDARHQQHCQAEPTQFYAKRGCLFFDFQSILKRRRLTGISDGPDDLFAAVETPLPVSWPTFGGKASTRGLIQYRVAHVRARKIMRAAPYF
jgi:hypothetical protein